MIARAARPSGATPCTSRQPQEPAGAGELAHAAAAVRLEVGRQRQEHLRGRERVALRDVRAVSRQAEALRRRSRAAHQPGSPSPRWMQSSRQSSAVSTIRRGMRVPSAPQRLPQEGALDPGGVRDRRAAAHGGRERRAAPPPPRAPRPGRPRAARGSRPRRAPAPRSGWTSPPTPAAVSTRPSSTGSAGERDDLVARRVEAGRLDVHDEEAGARARSGSPRAQAEAHADARAGRAPPPGRPP